MSTDLATARYLAQGMFPTRARATEAPPPDVATLLEACRANKLPLLSLPENASGRDVWPYAPTPNDLTPAPLSLYLRARAAEAEEGANQRREYLRVGDALAAAGIRAVFIKAVGLPPSFPYKSDNLDILVALEQGSRARRILRDNDYVEVRNVEEPHKFLFRRFHLGRSISAVHLHESVGWGTGFMDDAGVLARARPAPDDPQIAIPAPEDALLITMAHAFYEDKAIKLSDLWRVVYLLRQGGLDWAALTAQVTQRGWREGLHTCIALWAALEVALYGEHSFPAAIAARAGQEAPAFSQEYLRQRLAEEVRFPFRVSFAFSKQHYYRKVWADQALSPAQKGLDALRHSLAGIRRRLPFRSQRPLLVTLSGMDGSGKTAVAEMLAAALQECEISARVVWSRGGSSALTDRVIALVKPLLPRERGSAPLDMTSDTRAAKVARKSHWLRRPLLRWGWRWLVVLDLLARYTAQVAWPLWRGRVVISDRYVVDALVELAALTGDKGEWRSLAARALMALCPRPRWALYLDVSPQAALQRKPEETLSYLKQQAPLYGQAARLGRLQRVDAAGDLATVADPLVEAVLRDYLDGYHTLVNALFLANPLPLEEG